MRDPEFIRLRNRFLFAVLIAVIFTVPLLMFVYKSYASSSLIDKIDRKETFTVLVVDKNCSLCDEVEEILDSNNVSYLKLNHARNKDYDLIMRKLGLDNPNKNFPIIVYVDKGKMVANLFVDDDKNFVVDFLNTYNLVNSN